MNEKERTSKLNKILLALTLILIIINIIIWSIFFALKPGPQMPYVKLEVSEARWASMKLVEEYNDLRSDIAKYNLIMSIDGENPTYDIDSITEKIIERTNVGKITINIIDNAICKESNRMTIGLCDRKNRVITISSIEFMRKNIPVYQAAPTAKYKFTHEEIYIFSLVHEIIHILEPKVNERETDFLAFKFLYEFDVFSPEDAAIRAAGIHIGWRHVEGIRPKDYNAGYQISRYYGKLMMNA